LREAECELTRLFVVDRHRDVLARSREVAAGFLRFLQCGFGLLARRNARRTHEHDGVVDLVFREARLRLHVLRENAQCPSFLAIQELTVAIRLDGAALSLCHARRRAQAWIE